jgi:dephospho-CoA kinase
MPYTIGLTGGIASGKSAVAAGFERRGITVLDADAIARELVAPGEPLLAALIELVGPEARAANGSLDRAYVRERIFANPALRKSVEALLHPPIRARLAARAAADPGPYVVLAIPLLVEGGERKGIDRVLVVDCPEALQIDRLRSRDGLSEAQARAALAAQATRSERIAAADDLIANTAGLEALDHVVATLHERYLALAGRRR